MPGLSTAGLEWPYIEGLRMDEAMHPLTLMVVGLYGKVLPNQNGAPLRVHIPWKYGFKSGKSIVRIRLTDKQPQNTWAVQTPNEYGFYANVNPTVDHPRWSQAREQRLPSLLHEPADADVQRLRRSGGEPLRRHGSPKVLLMIARLWQRLAALLAAIANWRFFKPAVFVAAACRLSLLSISSAQLSSPATNVEALGVDPTMTLLHETGETALGILLITLSVTPIRRLFKVNRLQIVRRMLGVWSFTYALLHLTIYLVVRSAVLLARRRASSRDLAGHPQTAVHLRGQAGVLILLLARRSPRRPAGCGGSRRTGSGCTGSSTSPRSPAIVHFIWIQKSDIREPLRWGVLAAAVVRSAAVLQRPQASARARPLRP